jgi:hypothetical protein
MEAPRLNYVLRVGRDAAPTPATPSAELPTQPMCATRATSTSTAESGGASAGAGGGSGSSNPVGECLEGCGHCCLQILCCCCFLAAT